MDPVSPFGPPTPVRVDSGSSRRGSISFPEKYYLARQYAYEGPLREDTSVDEPDRLLLYALSQLADHGPCKEPQPSMWDASEVKAKWRAWNELGDKVGKMEAMFKFVQSIELLAPAWMSWPPLGLEGGPPATPGAIESDAAARAPAWRPVIAPTAAVPAAAAPASAVAPSSNLPPPAPPPATPERASAAAADPSDADAAMVAALDSRLVNSRRQSASPADTTEAAADAQLVSELARRLGVLLRQPPRTRSAVTIVALLHSLACLAALSTSARSRCLDVPDGALELAVRAAAPAAPSELELPTAVQHLALMVQVNVALSPEGARQLSRRHGELLQDLSERAEDPRARSLARCALENIAQHAGLLHHLTTRAAPGKLQLAAPRAMLATFARLDASCHSAPPPCMPGNRQLPSGYRSADPTTMSAAELDAAADAVADAALAAADSAAAAAVAVAAAAPVAAAAAAAGGETTPSAAPSAVNSTTPRPVPPSAAPSAVHSALATPATARHPSATSLTESTAAGIAAGIASRAAARPPDHAHHGASAEGPSAVAGAGAEAETEAASVLAVRACAKELHTAFGLRPLARATAPWGAAKLGVALSSLGFALQHAQQHGSAAQISLLAALAHEYELAARLFGLLGACEARQDTCGTNGTLWCLAELAHCCGGRVLRLPSHPEHEAKLFEALHHPATPCVLLALACLRAAAADPLSVRRVARELRMVQQLFKSDSCEIALLACAVVANVESYSHARLWYSRAHTEAAKLLDTAAPAAPFPLALYSAAPRPPPILADLAPTESLTELPLPQSPTPTPREAADAAVEAAVRAVPRLACQLHPWIAASVRRSAVLRLAATLHSAWLRGSHDPLLLYLMEASLLARRLVFALERELDADEPARHACLFALSLVPLLGGAALVATPEVLQGRVLAVCIAPAPTDATLALHIVRNASADPRLCDVLLEAGVLPALQEAASKQPFELAVLACGALANLEQLAQHSAEAGKADGAPAVAQPEPPHIGEPHAPPLTVPPSLLLAAAAASDVLAAVTLSGDGAAGGAFADADAAAAAAAMLPGGAVGSMSHRALPCLCQQFAAWAPPALQERGLAFLGLVLASRSVDSGMALELLRRAWTVTRLLNLLHDVGDAEDEDALAAAEAAASAASSGRVAPPPAQPDGALRDGALHALALIAHRGGLRLFEQAEGGVARVASVLGGALLAPTAATRAHAAAFWCAACVWEPFAALLLRAIFSVNAAVAVGLLLESKATTSASSARRGAFVNGLGVLQALAEPHDLLTAPSAERAAVLDGAYAAAGALANLLQHPRLRPLWTYEADKLAYLVRVDAEEETRLLRLPERLLLPDSEGDNESNALLGTLVSAF